MSVLFGDSLDSIRGSLSKERASGPNPAVFIHRKLKKLRRLNQRYTIPLSAGPEIFYDKLSEVTALYPELPLEVSIGGLSQFEGKNSQKKILQLLMYLATLDESWKFLIDILLERIVGRYYNRKAENLGKIGEETLQLIKVFGCPVVRQRYLSERYSEKKLRDNTARGELFFSNLRIRFFDARPVKTLERKRGYNDHGSLKANHEYHGEKEVEGMDIQEEKQTVQEILLEIYKKSTENYLRWLESRMEPKEQTNNNKHNEPHNERKDDNE